MNVCGRLMNCLQRWVFKHLLFFSHHISVKRRDNVNKVFYIIPSFGLKRIVKQTKNVEKTHFNTANFLLVLKGLCEGVHPAKEQQG